MHHITKFAVSKVVIGVPGTTRTSGPRHAVLRSTGWNSRSRKGSRGLPAFANRQGLTTRRSPPRSWSYGCNKTALRSAQFGSPPSKPHRPAQATYPTPALSHHPAHQAPMPTMPTMPTARRSVPTCAPLLRCPQHNWVRRPANHVALHKPPNAGASASILLTKPPRQPPVGAYRPTKGQSVRRPAGRRGWRRSVD